VQLNKPWHRGVLISLVLGVVTTVSVAWCGAVFESIAHAEVLQGGYRTKSFSLRFDIYDASLNTSVIWTCYESTAELDEVLDKVGGQGRREELPEWTRAQAPQPEDIQSKYAKVVELDIASGWPMRAMHASVRQGQTASARSGILLESRRVSMPYGSADIPRALPLRPMALGFMIDTLAFASSWWLLFHVGPTMRWYLRYRRSVRPILSTRAQPTREEGGPESGSEHSFKPA